jgi:hypothetical protein
MPMAAHEPTLLTYETPRQSPRVRIERFADGGVTVHLRQARLDRQRLGLMPLLLAALAAAFAIFKLARRMPYYHDRILLVGGAVIAAAASLIAIRTVRSTQSTVIGVSPKGVYVDHPQWLLRRRRYFRRAELVICQPVTSEILGPHQTHSGVFEHSLEVRFRHGPAVWLLQGAEMAEVRLASDALRDALGMDQPGTTPTTSTPSPDPTPRA